MHKYKKNKNFRIIETPYQKSLGVCHARHNIQKLHDGEEYHLQLDSHHRFVKNWDEKIKKCFNKLKNSKIDKYSLKKDLHNLIKAGLSLSEASIYLAKKNDLKKNTIYALY